MCNLSWLVIHVKKTSLIKGQKYAVVFSHDGLVGSKNKCTYFGYTLEFDQVSQMVARKQACGRLQMDDYDYNYKQFNKGDYDYTKLEKDDYD